MYVSCRSAWKRKEEKMMVRGTRTACCCCDVRLLVQYLVPAMDDDNQYSFAEFHSYYLVSCLRTDHQGGVSVLLLLWY